jgi:hypothetical protein
MITIPVMGGLGNQMFQYAAAKALAERHGVGVAIDIGNISRDPLRSYLLDRLQVPERPAVPGREGPPLADAMALSALKWRGRAERLLKRFTDKGIPQLPATYSEKHFHFDPEFFDQGPTVRLFGYFQSELYFSDIAATLRNVFQPREPLGPAAQKIARDIADTPLSVSVHVRRGDYVRSATTAQVHGVLDAAYYARALRLISGLLGQAVTLFVFSDEPDAAEAVVASVPGLRTVIVRGDPDRPWEDMALMARCRHHVIANSSFSWWGAWLNPSPDKIVIGPRQWFTPPEVRTKNLCDLCPAGWILI